MKTTNPKLLIKRFGPEIGCLSQCFCLMSKGFQGK